ncbi:PEP-CTERM sorting domain-containing protein [Akkermansia glycaniphila]|uniref:PEP-CTERM sorting domain-containing protein n=1 Tax=Akkermansia glycaniphila TaxID=1679444 RepID=UPI001C0342C0|nr:PEP-CTERM sorting domain-containing protein [Akkermansia glycaniphila]MBT9450660.1 PEP-CTERM sorting domain-containing protein [Akkermansia glycaniphila]
MKTPLLLATLPLLSSPVLAARVTIASQWNDFSSLTAPHGGQHLSITLNGGATVDSNDRLVLNGQAGSFARISFPSTYRPGWLPGQSYGIQLTISGLQAQQAWSQLFMYNSVSAGKESGVAINTTGMITDGANQASWGSTFGADAIGPDSFTLTVIQTSTAGVGTRYYINGEYVNVNTSGWIASNQTWNSIDFGNSYKTYAGAAYAIETLAFFHVDSATIGDLDTAAKTMYGLVPEPATATLGLAGLAALMLRRRRSHHS